MTFINCDTGALLTLDDQIKVLGNTMSDLNRNLINKYFSPKSDYYQQFDRINCQFVMHFMLASKITWNNFLENVNTFLKPGGIMLITCFDADKVIDFMGDNQKRTVRYTDERGISQILFEIIRQYDRADYEQNKKENKKLLGYAIDVFNAIAQEEGGHNTEYLVEKDFVINQFRKKCNMELIDTCLFEDFIKNNKKFLELMVQYEEKPEMQSYYKKLYEFYDLTKDINRASMELSKLNRMYIFKKRDDAPNDFFVPGKFAYKQVNKQMKKVGRAKQNKSNNIKGGYINKHTNSNNKIDIYASYNDDELEFADAPDELELANVPDELVNIADVPDESVEIPDKSNILDELVDTSYKFDVSDELIDIPDELIKVPIKSGTSNNREVSLDYLEQLLASKKFIRRRIDDRTIIGSIIDICNTYCEKDVTKKILRATRKYNDIKDLNKIATNLKFKSGSDVFNCFNIFVIEEGEFDINTTNNDITLNNPSMLIYKAKNKYCPIYKLKNSKYKGVFDSNLPIIKSLMENDNAIEMDFI
jgi:SAM-dependent methyltransferase